MLNRELREPQRRGRRDAAGAGPAAGQLQVQSIDVLEHQPAVHLGHTIVVAALDAIGVRHADARIHVPGCAARAECWKIGLSAPLADANF